jgi:hypothetical protein
VSWGQFQRQQKRMGFFIYPCCTRYQCVYMLSIRIHQSPDRFSILNIMSIRLLPLKNKWLNISFIHYVKPTCTIHCTVGLHHKVLIYVEYRAVSGVFQNIDPPPPLHPASVSSPRTKSGGGTHSPGDEGVGGGGSTFWKTPDIGLASYSIIPLRATNTVQYHCL